MVRALLPTLKSANSCPPPFAPFFLIKDGPVSLAYKKVAFGRYLSDHYSLTLAPETLLFKKQETFDCLVYASSPWIGHCGQRMECHKVVFVTPSSCSPSRSSFQNPSPTPISSTLTFPCPALLFCLISSVLHVHSDLNERKFRFTYFNAAQKMLIFSNQVVKIQCLKLN